MTFLAGGYARIEAGSSGFAKTMYISPNYLAQTAMFNTIYGQSITSNIQLLSTQGCIGILWIIIILMFTAASVSGRRKMA
jgi:ABC-2 type transport system permease protein